MKDVNASRAILQGSPLERRHIHLGVLPRHGNERSLSGYRSLELLADAPRPSGDGDVCSRYSIVLAFHAPEVEGAGRKGHSTGDPCTFSMTDLVNEFRCGGDLPYEKLKWMYIPQVPDLYFSC